MLATAVGSVRVPVLLFITASVFGCQWTACQPVRQPPEAQPSEPQSPGVQDAGQTEAKAPAADPKVGIALTLRDPKLLSSGRQTTYLMIELLPFQVDDAQQRTPVNVALVLDRSGSMHGQKIVHAKEAVRRALRWLRPGDQVALVAYNHEVAVLAPIHDAEKPDGVLEGLEGLNADGTTALYAGVEEGAKQLRTQLSRDRVNRIVLMSDGLANVGPRLPAELGELGSRLMNEGISVTTIGLGLDYDEDLMTQLAMRSQGNHFFAQEPTDLDHGFELEFGKGLAVVAQEVEVRLQCGQGVRPVRVLNSDASLEGDRVEIRINQLYSGRRAMLLVELEVDPALAGGSGRPHELTTVEMRYRNLATGAQDQRVGGVQASFGDDPAQIAGSQQKPVVVAVAKFEGQDRILEAMKLGDKGKIDEAKAMLEKAAAELKTLADQFGSAELTELSKRCATEAVQIQDRSKWKEQRKRSATIQVIRLPSSAY